MHCCSFLRVFHCCNGWFVLQLFFVRNKSLNNQVQLYLYDSWPPSTLFDFYNFLIQERSLKKLLVNKILPVVKASGVHSPVLPTIYEARGICISSDVSLMRSVQQHQRKRDEWVSQWYLTFILHLCSEWKVLSNSFQPLKPSKFQIF